MLRATWTAGSLRLWVFVGMALTVMASEAQKQEEARKRGW